MAINTGIKVLAGAAALALSSGAMAVTTAGTNGTIWLSIDDTTNHTSYMFDTGLTVSAFTGNTSYGPHSVASDANYTAFIAGEGNGDSVQYSVIGAINNSTAPLYEALFTSLASPTPQFGSSVYGAAQNAGLFLSSANNPSGGSTYFSGSTIALGWVNSGNAAGFNSNTGVPDSAGLGTPMAFYETTTTHPNSTTKLGTLATLAGTWNFSAGSLSYTASPVPLPAPLLLLVSGLGLMGVVGRRRQSA